jgi:hypothetical protein
VDDGWALGVKAGHASCNVHGKLNLFSLVQVEA